MSKIKAALSECLSVADSQIYSLQTMVYYYSHNPLCADQPTVDVLVAALLRLQDIRRALAELPEVSC